MQKQHKKEKDNPIAQFSEKYLGRTICKISSPDNTTIEDIVKHLKLGFKVEPTSPVMWNQDLRQFHVFVAVSKREV